MPTRRDMILVGAAAMAIPRTGWAAPVPPAASRLETRLFNFKASVPAIDRQDILAELASLSKDSGVGGFMVGRNIVNLTYPTRFESMYMIQFDAPSRQASGTDAHARFNALRNDLASHCSGAVVCDLQCQLPARYADAAGVTIRHTVMFDFKPSATADACKRNVDAIRGMGKLPMVQRYVVEPSAGNAADPDQMQWQVIGDFASMADYNAYAQAPVHLAIRKDFTENTSRVTWLDVAL